MLPRLATFVASRLVHLPTTDVVDVRSTNKTIMTTESLWPSWRASISER